MRVSETGGGESPDHYERITYLGAEGTRNRAEQRRMLANNKTNIESFMLLLVAMIES